MTICKTCGKEVKTLINVNCANGLETKMMCQDCSKKFIPQEKGVET